MVETPNGSLVSRSDLAWLEKLIKEKFKHVDEKFNTAAELSKERWADHSIATQTAEAATEAARKRSEEEVATWRASHNGLLTVIKENAEKDKLERVELMTQFALKKDLETLEDSVKERGYIGKGIRLTFGTAAASIAALATFVGLIVVLANVLTPH
jgi:hypothetical protein